jgi:hypothetical protein
LLRHPALPDQADSRSSGRDFSSSRNRGGCSDRANYDIKITRDHLADWATLEMIAEALLDSVPPPPE